MSSQTLLEIKNLKKAFGVEKNFFGKTTKTLKAVNGLNFEIKKGECLSLVGESGCGKSTTARLILKLINPDDGEVVFYRNGDKDDVLKLSASKLREMRAHMQIVFQNPDSSLDPRYKIFDTVAEPMRVHGWDSKKIHDRVFELLDLVDLDEDLAHRFPHQCSGGQKQRVGIARALALNPEFIIADEAVSALDVSVQAKVLELIKKLQKELGITFLFITHDLGVVKNISDRVAVMYLGEIVEMAPTEELFNNPLHPYTQALLSAAPIADPKQRNRKRIFLDGDVPSPIDIPSGCPFHTRCPLAKEECRVQKPVLEDKVSKKIESEHKVSCLLVR